MEETKPSILSAALVRAKQRVKATVYKAGRNEAQRFTYVGHEHVIEHIREALLSEGLDWTQTNLSLIGEFTHVASKGPTTILRWSASFSLIHAATGERRLLGPYEGTTQTGDKVSYVASTALDRTALLRLFNLAGSKDEDVESPTHPNLDDQPQQQQRASAPQQAQQPQPNAPTVANSSGADNVKAVAIAQVRKLREQLDLTIPELMALCDGKTSDQMTMPEIIKVITALENMLSSRNNYEQPE